ncbi:nucleotidyltransferase family protein [Enterococcus faecium]|mgnify:CR=1 FL=1|uniref:nucleotidyltransferase family protein n=1 Tax=Enterococcus faecium TaxID=1352 RepID=UPI0008130F55|nr:nucleotidyltransferase domain-containing protein [Enterococcus faecium]EGP5215756.1 nucleotidyltransferase domain-containing protein [Enterococcus faecium]EME8238984.1 nucleotidyltransferase domain-containing protein [Enterococcus faecium]EME8255647.1 nucleotidyltransferase domain-containing protein [Enterococcus faecium]MCO5433516.1 nucleotidyltransferase domain-containing protein [Enterococcus faecium]MCO5451547.1 nucleotidyltransferase domain-containing protein [Enterococcus faecium]
MVLTVDEIKERVKPVAEKYEIPVVYIFGSYARDEATNESDIDFLVGTTGLPEKYRWSVYSDFFDELKEAVDHEIDLVEMEAFDEPLQFDHNKEFFKKMMKERVKVFERQKK